jgi:hypothetical protein
LTCDVPPELVDEMTELAGCREKRSRLLPARAVVYFVLGLCLFSGADSMGPPGYRSVMRSLMHGARHVAGLAVPSASALCRARQRLGAKPFELLFERLAGPVAAAGEAGAFALGLLLVAWDGTGIDVPASAATIAAFGTAAGAGPQLRLMALVECGTHAVIGAAFDGLARASEHVLARRLLACLRPGMLLLADRNFPGWELWGLAAGTGAELCWRVQDRRVLEPVVRLPDGSFTAVMPTPEAARTAWKRRQRGLPPLSDGHRVRVIEYSLTVTRRDGTSRTEAFRLVTTLLDPQRAPAAELAALYHERWEAENGYAELKTRLRGAGFTLRSRTPELACQEMWAFLIVWQAISALRRQAAAQASTDPDRASFTVAIRIARDHARTWHDVPADRDRAIAAIISDLLPPRRDRQCPREKKRPRNTYPTRKTGQPRPPGTVTYAIHVTTNATQPAPSP